METIITWLIGIGMICAGIYLIWRAFYSLTKFKEEVTGRIVDLEKSVRRGRTQYYPIVEYYGGGKKIVKKVDYSSKFMKKNAIGDEVVITYNSDNPEDFAVKGKSFKSNFGWGLACLILGVIVIIGQVVTGGME